jgi:hypothetical protein
MILSPPEVILYNNRMKKLPLLFLGILVAITLILRFRIAYLKPFDPDELMHLHSTWLITHGYLPYKDFFIGYPPSFFLFLSPLFLFLPPSELIPVAVRQLVFIQFLVLLFLFYRLARRVMTPLFALLGVLLMTTSVFLLERGVEIRPDALVLILWIICAYLLGKIQEVDNTRIIAVCGLLTGVAATITQKAIYGTLFVGVLLLYVLWPLIAKKKYKPVLRYLLIFAGTFVAPLLVVLIYMAANSLLPYIPDFLIRYPLHVGTIYHWDHPWYHLGIFRGFTETAYFTYLYKKSHIWMFETQAMWVGALGLFPIWAYLVLRRWKKLSSQKKYFLVFLISGLIIFMTYLLVIPSKIPQYWYLPTPFVALSLVLGLSEITKLIPNLKYTLLPLIFLGLTLITLSLWTAWNKDLTTNNNGRQLLVIHDILARTSATATVYDGIGGAIFRPDCYYFGMLLPNEIPQDIFKDIMEIFAAGKCDYVVEGLFNRMEGWSYGENNYIYTHFVQWADNRDVWERKK